MIDKHERRIIIKAIMIFAVMAVLSAIVSAILKEVYGLNVFYTMAIILYLGLFASLIYCITKIRAYRKTKDAKNQSYQDEPY